MVYGYARSANETRPDINRQKRELKKWAPTLEPIPVNDRRLLC